MRENEKDTDNIDEIIIDEPIDGKNAGELQKDSHADASGNEEALKNGLEQKLIEKDFQIADLLDKLQRSMAEFDNARKRTQKEKANIYEEAVKETVLKFLPVIDNFERALTAGSSESDSSFYKGIEMILKQFIDILDSIGVKEIRAVNEKFDHNIHFAVAHVEDKDYDENVVIEDMQKGYMYKDKVLRCSMVKVAN